MFNMNLLKKIKNKFFPNRKQQLIKSIHDAISKKIMIGAEIGEKIEKSDEYNEQELYAVIYDLKSSCEEISKAEQKSRDDLVTNLKEDDTSLKYVDKLKDSIGRKRHQMPQVDANNIADFILHFKDKVGLKKVTKKLSDLKPAQDEINEDKVYDALARKFDSDEDTKYIISNDDYIVDGHHRWAADLELDADDSKNVECYRIDLPIKQLLKRANQLKITKKKDINDIEKSYLILNIEDDEDFDFDDNVYILKSLAPEIYEHIMYEHRPVGLSNDEYLDLLKAIEDNDIIKAQATKNEANKRALGLVPVRRIVRRDDGTSFSQIFWVQREQLNNNTPQSTNETNANVQSSPTTTQRQVKLSAKAKAIFKKQQEMEKLVKVGDDVSVRFIGSITGNKYDIPEGFKVVRIKANSIIVETNQVMHVARGTDKPMSFRAGQRFEIPKTSNPLWSEHQNFDLKIPEEEIKRRQEFLKHALNPDKIKEFKREGFEVFSALENQSPEYVAAYLEKYMEKWKGFDVGTLFRNMKSLITNHFGDKVKSRYTISTDNRIGKMHFNIRVANNNGDRLMYMERNEANAGGEFQGKKGISHSYFSIDPYYQGGGFCKRMFKELYAQYVNSDVDYLSVHANLSVGGYTWASMGFHVNLTTARSMLGYFRKGKEKCINFGECSLIPGKGDVDDIKIEESSIKIKFKGDEEFKDVSEEMCIKPESKQKYESLQIQIEELEIRSKETATEEEEVQMLEEAEKLKEELGRIRKIKRYEVKKENGVNIIVDNGKLEYYEITQEDADEAKRIFEQWINNNPGSNRFPAKLFANIGNKKAGKAALLGTDWDGTCDLKNPNERILFEKAIGWENPVILSPKN